MSRKEIDYQQLALNKKMLDTAFISPGFAPSDIDYKKLFFALKKQIVAHAKNELHPRIREPTAPGRTDR